MTLHEPRLIVINKQPNVVHYSQYYMGTLAGFDETVCMLEGFPTVAWSEALPGSVVNCVFCLGADDGES
jgi:hypothetical protein